jgi:hypothetical protein
VKISEFYKYSWFADLAYVEWDDNQTVTFNVAGFDPSVFYDETRP